MDILIQDLLLFSTVSKESLELGPVILADLVKEILSSHQEEFTSRKALCTVEIDSGHAVHAHRATLRQVVWNLLANAAKFVAPGTPPRIVITSQPVEGAIRLTIVDNGIGIAPEYQEQIFKIFERIHPEKYEGSGMGLAIVRQAVERMEGRLGVTSEPGKGSSFWIELPKEKPEREAA